MLKKIIPSKPNDSDTMGSIYNCSCRIRFFFSNLMQLKECVILCENIYRFPSIAIKS